MLPLRGSIPQVVNQGCLRHGLRRSAVRLRRAPGGGAASGWSRPGQRAGHAPAQPATAIDRGLTHHSEETGQYRQLGARSGALTCRGLQQGDLSAMGVEQNQATNAQLRQLAAHAFDQRQNQLGGQADRAGNRCVPGRNRRTALEAARSAALRRSREERHPAGDRQRERRWRGGDGDRAAPPPRTARPRWLPGVGLPPGPLARTSVQNGVAEPALTQSNLTSPVRLTDRRPRWFMAANGSPQKNRKPLQVMQINRREDEQDRLQREASEARAAADAAAEKARQLEEAAGLSKPARPAQPSRPQSPGASLSDEERFGTAELEGMSMADLLGAPDDKPRSRPPAEANRAAATATSTTSTLTKRPSSLPLMRRSQLAPPARWSAAR